MSKYKLMLAEDDVNLGSLLKQYLEAKNFETDLYYNGEDALKAFLKKPYDLCILDVMLPQKDGFDVAKNIKSISKNVPVIFLTAKVMKEDVLKGFRIGADDYITKPFDMDELLYRIEAVMRRIGIEPQEEQQQFEIGNLTFDSQSQTIFFNDTDNSSVKLTSKESELLKLMCLHKNTIMRRDFALKIIWNSDNYFNARSMDVYITKLRKILQVDERIKIINKHGEGYKLIVRED